MPKGRLLAKLLLTVRACEGLKKGSSGIFRDAQLRQSTVVEKEVFADVTRFVGWGIFYGLYGVRVCTKKSLSSVYLRSWGLRLAVTLPLAELQELEG